MNEFNVKSYGAQGNGVDDDRPEIEAAMAAAVAAGGGIVYFPAGTYIVSRKSSLSYALDIPGDNLRLVGERGLSWIKHPTGMPDASVAIVRCTTRKNVTFEDLGFDGNWGWTAGVDSNAGINHTTQTTPQNYGLMLRSTVNCTVRHCQFRQTYGDAIWVGSGGGTLFSEGAVNTRILDCDIQDTARDGIAMGQKCEGVTIERCSISNTYSSPIDTEPQEQPVRDVVIDGCTLRVWWNAANPARSGNFALTVVGGKFLAPGEGAVARNFRITNNNIYGAVLVESAKDVVVDSNRIVCDWNNYSYAPVTVQMYADDIRVTNNTIYDRTTGISSRSHDAAIQVQIYASGSTNLQPANVLVAHNHVNVGNGRHGIKVEGTGSLAYSTGAMVPGETGTATTITEHLTATGSSTVFVTGKSWPADQWQGYFIRIGDAIASIASNTNNTLTLWMEDEGPTPDKKSAWTNWLGKAVTTPANGSTYVIFGESGLVDVVSNHIDCSNRGYGNGGYGIQANAFRAGQRVRIRGNNIKNANDAAVTLITYDANRKFVHLEVTDNMAWDDQLTATCTKVVLNTGTLVADKLIIRGNTGTAAMTPLSGLTTGKWLVNDGVSPQWTGYGAPDSAPAVTAPVGATYLRLDGSTSTTLYVKTSGTGSTGWTAK